MRRTCEKGERSGLVPEAMVASLQTMRKDTAPSAHASARVTQGLAVQLQQAHPTRVNLSLSCEEGHGAQRARQRASPRAWPCSCGGCMHNGGCRLCCMYTKPLSCILQDPSALECTNAALL